MNERYTEEFRQEAVRLAITGNISKADVARDLGSSVLLYIPGSGSIEQK